jgi:hypothetical protein
MNNVITVLAALALAVGTGYVIAQTTPLAASPPASAPPPKTPPTAKPPADMPTTPQANTPPPARPGTPMSPMAPDFSTLDRKGVGYITSKDAAGNDWLTRNFKTCDTDKNDQVSHAEYTACTTRP